MFKPKISKDELNEMPVGAFAGEITLVDNPEKAEKAILELQKAGMVGVDMKQNLRLRVVLIIKYRWYKFPQPNIVICSGK
jgi:hypothetical protein